MNSCDKPGPKAGASHLAIAVSILLLSLAVFGWGLHSKLSLYHLRARASEGTPIAKLLSERERPVDIALHCDLNQAELHAAALAATAVLVPYPSLHSSPVPPRNEEQPTWSRTLARKGPSLRRPPPSLLA